MRPAKKRNIMSKYIDAEKLIAEIERRRSEAEKIFNHVFEYASSAKEISEWVSREYNNILSYIISIQQEQPQVADASKMERLNVDILLDWSMRFAPDIRDAIEATAYHFWNLAINSRKEK